MGERETEKTYIVSPRAIKPTKVNLITGSRLTHTSMRHANRVPVGYQPLAATALVDKGCYFAGVI